MIFCISYLLMYKINLILDLELTLSCKVVSVMTKVVNLYQIGELSKLLGVSEHRLRYYEKEGLVVPLRKGKNRIYSDEDKEWLEFILHMKSTGMALVDIKKYSLMRKEDEHGEKHAQELMEILVKHRDEVAAQLKIAIYHDGVNSNR